ncbi:hypothetical protein [Streptomyces violascens]|uniref:hypothetical protein n=1 Tax=Streptomyces violascens TaxID=67381 RepID=UPI003647D004
MSPVWPTEGICQGGLSVTSGIMRRRRLSEQRCRRDEGLVVLVGQVQADAAAAVGQGGPGEEFGHRGDVGFLLLGQPVTPLPQLADDVPSRFPR